MIDGFSVDPSAVTNPLRVLIDPDDIAGTSERLFVGLDAADPRFHTMHQLAVLFAYDSWMLDLSGMPGLRTEIILSTGRDAWRINAQIVADILGTQESVRAVGLLLCKMFRTAKNERMIRDKAMLTTFDAATITPDTTIH